MSRSSQESPVFTEIGLDRRDFLKALAASAALVAAGARVREITAKREHVDVGNVSLSGFPEATDTLTLDIAKEQSGDDAVEYVNTIAGDWIINTGEPGVSLYGSRQDALDANVQEAIVDDWFINGVTQELFENKSGNFNIVEGQFMVASLGEGTLKIRGQEDVYTIDMPGEKGHNYLVVVRGLYGDDQPDTDRNRTARFTNLAQDGGHATAMRYPKGTFV